MTLEFTCNGYDKKTYNEITYTIEISVLPEYADYFKELYADGNLTASYSNETVNIALRELSWFKGYIFRHVTKITERKNCVYLVMLVWSTDDDNGTDYYIYADYSAAKAKYNGLIEDENDADISWIGSEVFDENGDVNDGYKLECSEETGEKQDLYWNVSDTGNGNRYSYINLTKVKIN
ncbi:MAG: hypothetical protein NC131_16605 [Roseburia sp.]|nr:hypothetical protein [Roseburia sp.]